MIDTVRTALGRLHMGWDHVLFANWPIDPATLRPHVPDALAIDTHDGDAYLSVVPYTNVDVRPPWMPTGTGIGLPELNLRTYVTHDAGPGVYFLSLDADGILGVLGARLFHFLPYYNAAITMHIADRTVRFTSDRRHPGARALHFEATYQPSGDPFTPDPDSLPHFLTERYRYYTEAPDGLRYADVDHPPWTLYPATATLAADAVFTANGLTSPTTDPRLYYSPGTDTTASGSHRLP